MTGYVQRYPFSPKAVWWKRFTEEDQITGNANEVMKFERNNYLRMFAFDCTRETDQQDGIHQPITGLFVESSYLTVKTQNFAYLDNAPKQDDIVFFDNRYWMIAEATMTTSYEPRAKKTLHLALKAIKR